MRKYALSVGHACGRVVGLVGFDAIAELPREKAGQMRTAHRTGKGIRLVGKIARAIREGRHGNQPGIDALALPRALIIAKNEKPVFPDRPSHSSAELILTVKAAFRGEKVTGVQIRIAQELKGASMQLIGSGARHHVDYAAAIVAEFGVKIVGEDPEFGDGIEIRNNRSATVHQLFYVTPINHESVGIFALSAYGLVPGIQC